MKEILNKRGSKIIKIGNKSIILDSNSSTTISEDDWNSLDFKTKNRLKRRFKITDLLMSYKGHNLPKNKNGDSPKLIIDSIKSIIDTLSDEGSNINGNIKLPIIKDEILLDTVEENQGKILIESLVDKKDLIKVCLKDKEENYKFETLNNLITKSSGIYLIDLDMFGIIEGRIDHNPPFSQEEYDIAYNNKQGIRNALNYAHDNNYTEAIFPRGNYDICYDNMDNTPDTYVIHSKYEIIIPSYLKVNLNKATIRVIFDSDNRNPYDKSTSYLPYKLPGNVFSFTSSYNSSLENGTIEGDIYHRSWIHPNDTWGEQTYGVWTSRGSVNCKAKNLIVKGFMGDAFSGMSNPDKDKFGNGTTSSVARNFYPGQLDRSDGTIITRTTSYTTDFINRDIITSGKEFIMTTNLGYHRFPDFASQFLIIAWYDTNQDFIHSEDFTYLQLTKIPDTAKYLRITCMGEADGEVSVYKTFRLIPPSPHNLTIKDCVITENHRGGISNTVNNTLIERCRIYNNGLGWRENVPRFPDTTRYQINFEDVIANEITIKNCEIDGSFNGLLLGGLKVSVLDCKIMNVMSVTGYHVQSLIVTGNTFVNCSRGIGITSLNIIRDVVFSNNILINTGLTDIKNRNAPNTSIRVSNITMRSQTTTIEYNPSLPDLMTIIGLQFIEEPNFEKIYKVSSIKGRLTDSLFKFLQPQYSTTSIYVDTLKGSKFKLICSEGKRVVNSGTIYGMTQQGGKQTKQLKVNGISTSNFYDCKLSINNFWYDNYGISDVSIATHTFSFYDCFIEKISEGDFFDLPTNDTTGMSDIILNFRDCIIKINPDVIGDVILFDIGHKGTSQNVTINMEDVTFDLSETSESIELCKHIGAENNVIFNFKNVRTIGSLTQSLVGYTINNI